MIKTYFVFSDIHSFYTLFHKALTDAGFDENNPNHCIISCGDLLDRGEESLQCLKFVNRIPDDRKILVRGNHEDLLQDALVRQDFKAHDYSNGTAYTIIDIGWDGESHKWSFENTKNNPELIKYISSLVDYAEVKDYIFTHGWIPCNRDDINKYHARNIHYTFNSDWKNGDWNFARWINGMDAWNQGIRIEGKTIVCGHWHTSWGHSKIHNNGPEWNNLRSTNPKHRYANFGIFSDKGIVAIDGCTAATHKVNIFKFEVEDD